MRNFLVAPDIGAQIQHGDLRIAHLRCCGIGLLQEGRVKMVELEHRNPVGLAQVGILPFGEIFVILAPSVCRQYIRTAIGIVHGQLLVAHMLIPLGSIKFCFFQ